MNVQHRTLNVQRRIMYSINLKKTAEACLAEVAAKTGSESALQFSSIHLKYNR